MSTWESILAGIVIYLLIGLMTAIINLVFIYKGTDSDDQALESFLCVVIWPLLAFFFIGTFIIESINDYGIKGVSAHIASRRHRYKVKDLQKKDAARLGQSLTDIMQNWEYSICRICFGKGCTRCSGGYNREPRKTLAK